MNRLNTFFSISALSLASSVSVAVADTKEFDQKKIDNATTTSIVNNQPTQNNQTDLFIKK